MRRFDGREPEERLPASLPEPLRFEPNKQYVRDVLASQVDLNFLGTEPVAEVHERFEEYQRQVHGGEKPPSEIVIDMHREQFGTDYRIETEGQHPVERLRQDATGGKS